MKKTSKLIKILVAAIIAITFFSCSGKVNAEDKKISIGDILDAGENWINVGNKGTEGLGNVSVDYFATQLIAVGQLLVAIGIGTLVIVSVIMAIKWITATPDKKAKLQQQLIGLVVATFVLFGAIGIWTLVRNIMENVENKLTANVNNEIVVVAQSDDLKI